MVQYVPRMKERKALSRRFHSTASVEQTTKPATDHTLERKCPTTHYISVPLPPNPLFSLLLPPNTASSSHFPSSARSYRQSDPLSLLLLRRFLSLLFLGDLFSTFSVVSLAVDQQAVLQLVSTTAILRTASAVGVPVAGGSVADFAADFGERGGEGGEDSLGGDAG